MPPTTSSSRSLGIAAPAGALLALALGVGVYFAPLPFLKPQKVQLPEVALPANADTAKPFVADSAKWTELAVALEAAREPAPDVVVGDEPKQPEQQTSAVPVVQLNWRYVGYIEEPRRLVGVFQIDATQHMVVEGEVLKDPNNPDRKGVTITKIERDKLTIDYHGTEMAFDVSKPSDETDLFAAPPGALGATPNLTGPSPGQLGPPSRRRANMTGNPGVNKPTPAPTPTATKPGQPRADRSVTHRETPAA